jgi:hypothetical protein
MGGSMMTPEFLEELETWLDRPEFELPPASQIVYECQALIAEVKRLRAIESAAHYLTSTSSICIDKPVYGWVIKGTALDQLQALLRKYDDA